LNEFTEDFYRIGTRSVSTNILVTLQVHILTAKVILKYKTMAVTSTF